MARRAITTAAITAKQRFLIMAFFFPVRSVAAVFA